MLLLVKVNQIKILTIMFILTLSYRRISAISYCDITYNIVLAVSYILILPAFMLAKTEKAVENLRSLYQTSTELAYVIKN